MATKLNKPLARECLTPLDGSFGTDKGKPLIASLHPGNGGDVRDTIVLRPRGTRRPEVITLQDVYRYAIRSRVNLEVLTKARETKAKKAARRESRRIQNADRKFKRPI